MRLIDADKLLQDIAETKVKIGSEDYMKGRESGLKWAKYLVRASVTIGTEVPAKHGYWRGTEYDGYADGYPVYNVYMCSECDYEIETDDEKPSWQFCPSCGAMMDKEWEHEID